MADIEDPYVWSGSPSTIGGPILPIPSGDAYKIRFRTQEDETKAASLLLCRGGYSLYGDGSFGLKREWQRRLLGEHGIPFDDVIWPEYTRIRIPDYNNRIRAVRLFDRSDGYTRYSGNIFGISRRQLRKLKWRPWISFEVID